MKTMLRSIATMVLSAVVLAAAQGIPDPQLTGTWSSKSNKTLTGPGFYDPVNEKMIEPTHAGISYSFTDDGYWESAYYRAISNPANPSCPKSIMQWQHGTFAKQPNGSLVLTPFAVDGRQLLSDPCRNPDRSIYTRFNVTEVFERYELKIDDYHKILRLNLFRFDGSPVMPLYLAYKPPQMLPTRTLNPTNTPTPSATGSKFKRSLFGGLADEAVKLPMNHKMMQKRKLEAQRMAWWNADGIWWFGCALTAVGSVLYFCF